MNIEDIADIRRLAIFKELDMDFICAAFAEGKRIGLLRDGYFTPDDLTFTMVYCQYGGVK